MIKTLVVLAAGIGSRFGGIKQLAKIWPNGETLLDYTIQDAIKVWFINIVYVIRKEIEDDFRALIGAKYESELKTSYVFQEIDPLRVKPWGTGQALFCAKDVIDSPFLLINADDYYGFDSMIQASMWLDNCSSMQFAMLGFVLKNTLSEFGSVNRGVCVLDHGKLSHINEVLGVQRQSGWILVDNRGDMVNPESIVSMNFRMFHPSLLQYLEQHFADRKYTANSWTEYYIWHYCNFLIESGRAECDVLVAKDIWYGITYKEDIGFVQKGVLGSLAPHNLSDQDKEIRKQP